MVNIPTLIYAKSKPLHSLFLKQQYIPTYYYGKYNQNLPLYENFLVYLSQSTCNKIFRKFDFFLQPHSAGLWSNFWIANKFIKYKFNFLQGINVFNCLYRQKFEYWFDQPSKIGIREIPQYKTFLSNATMGQTPANYYHFYLTKLEEKKPIYPEDSQYLILLTNVRYVKDFKESTTTFLPDIEPLFGILFVWSFKIIFDRYELIINNWPGLFSWHLLRQRYKLSKLENFVDYYILDWWEWLVAYVMRKIKETYYDPTMSWFRKAQYWGNEWMILRKSTKLLYINFFLYYYDTLGFYKLGYLWHYLLEYILVRYPFYIQMYLNSWWYSLRAKIQEKILNILWDPGYIIWDGTILWAWWMNSHWFERYVFYIRITPIVTLALLIILIYNIYIHTIYLYIYLLSWVCTSWLVRMLLYSLRFLSEVPLLLLDNFIYIFYNITKSVILFCKDYTFLIFYHWILIIEFFKNSIHWLTILLNNFKDSKNFLYFIYVNFTNTYVFCCLRIFYNICLKIYLNYVTCIFVKISIIKDWITSLYNYYVLINFLNKFVYILIYDCNNFIFFYSILYIWVFINVSYLHTLFHLSTLLFTPWYRYSDFFLNTGLVEIFTTFYDVGIINTTHSYSNSTIDNNTMFESKTNITLLIVTNIMILSYSSLVLTFFIDIYL